MWHTVGSCCLCDVTVILLSGWHHCVILLCSITYDIDALWCHSVVLMSGWYHCVILLSVRCHSVLLLSGWYSCVITLSDYRQTLLSVASLYDLAVSVASLCNIPVYVIPLLEFPHSLNRIFKHYKAAEDTEDVDDIVESFENCPNPHHSLAWVCWNSPNFMSALVSSLPSSLALLQDFCFLGLHLEWPLSYSPPLPSTGWHRTEGPGLWGCHLGFVLLSEGIKSTVDSVGFRPLLTERCIWAVSFPLCPIGWCQTLELFRQWWTRRTTLSQSFCFLGLCLQKVGNAVTRTEQAEGETTQAFHEGEEVNVWCRCIIIG